MPSTLKTKTKKRQSGTLPKKLPYTAFINALKQGSQNDDGPDPIQVCRDAGIDFPLAIIGVEELRITRLINWLQSKVFGTKTELNTYFGHQLTTANSMDPLLSSLKSMPLFAALEVVVLLNADKLKTAQADALIEAAQTSSPTSLLIITAAATKVKNPFAALLATCKTTVEIPQLKRTEVPAWITKELRSNGIKNGITKDAAQSLAAAYEGDLHSLSHEIAKLALVADPNDPVNAKMVASMCGGSPERTTFQLIQLIAQRNGAKASALLCDLLEQGLHPLQISGLLNRAFRTMLARKASSPATRNLLHDDLTNSWFLRNVSGAADLFTETDLTKSVHALCQLDMELKSSGLPPASHLESFVTRTALRTLP